MISRNFQLFRLSNSFEYSLIIHSETSNQVFEFIPNIGIKFYDDSDTQYCNLIETKTISIEIGDVIEYIDGYKKIQYTIIQIENDLITLIYENNEVEYISANDWEKFDLIFLEKLYTILFSN